MLLWGPFFSSGPLYPLSLSSHVVRMGAACLNGQVSSYLCDVTPVARRRLFKAGAEAAKRENSRSSVIRDTS